MIFIIHFREDWIQRVLDAIKLTVFTSSHLLSFILLPLKLHGISVWENLAFPVHVRFHTVFSLLYNGKHYCPTVWFRAISAIGCDACAVDSVRKFLPLSACLYMRLLPNTSECMCCLLSYSRRLLAKPTQFEIQPRNCCCFPLPFMIELQNSLLRSYISPLYPEAESSKYDNLKYTVY